MSFLSRPLVVAVVAAAGLTGCADMVTYSQDSRREGIELYNRQAYADSAGAFRNAVRQNPRDYRSYYYLGAAHEQMGQFQQAIASYKTSYQVINTTMEGKQDPEFRVRALNGLASAIARSDTRDIELNAVENRVRTRSEPDDHYLLGKIYALRGDADNAIESFTKAVTFQPENFHFAKEAGLYLDSIGQTNRAIPFLRRAYSLNVDDAQVSAALRKHNVIPGPGLNDESQLARPIVPKGPLPELPVGGVTATPQGVIRD